MRKMQLAGLGPLWALYATMLTACAMIPKTETHDRDPLCEVDAVITFSAMGDTAETVAAVRRHNAAFRAICSK